MKKIKIKKKEEVEKVFIIIYRWIGSEENLQLSDFSYKNKEEKEKERRNKEGMERETWRYRDRYIDRETETLKEMLNYFEILCYPSENCQINKTDDSSYW